MSGHSLTPEEYKSGKKAVYSTTVKLTLITIAEVALALAWSHLFPGSGKLLLNLLLVGMGLLKAFWIMGEFMHLKYETRDFVLSILVPVLLLLWFIVALLYDSSYWLNIRNVFAID